MEASILVINLLFGSNRQIVHIQVADQALRITGKDAFGMRS
ncbi:hypothetical protein NBG4_210032 [Candidatus Sulfobium mesophilum]|uniref:Uncharacterized protein n=1 Tax=Candidatus Sulfobium mesophilum TaxID=2016548 RepID=A0A2U3QG11_9BACT|nr:hypothetical protein NBG4_210032 [Candidatus Sulfobium mesophilum]